MARASSLTVLREFETLFQTGSVGAQPDGQLLERFAGRRGAGSEAAFEALVQRHGPMVLGVCRRVLGDPHDAEDAFQAVFLVLARRAGSIRQPDRLGPWLYGVTSRIARRIRVRRDRLRRREHPREALTGAEPVEAGCRPDHGPLVAEQAEALHGALGELPRRYRDPVVLCNLEGLTHEQAARRLGCPVGTVGVRLMRARAMLRDRLIRRGVAAPGALIAAGLGARAARAAVPSFLVAVTVGTALRGAGGAAAGTGSAAALALANGVVRAMLVTRATLLVAALLAVGTAGTVALRLVSGDGRREPAVARAAPGRSKQASKPAPTAVLPVAVDRAIEQGLRAARAEPDASRRAESLLGIGLTQIRLGDRPAARQTLALARRAADAIKPGQPTIIPHPLSRIGSAQAEAGDLAAAHRTFQRAAEAALAFGDDQASDTLFADLLPRQVQAGDIAGARESFEKVRKFLETTRDPIIRSFAPQSIILYQARAGDLAGALATLRNPKAFAFPQGERIREQALFGLVNADFRDRQAAEELLDEAMRVVWKEPGLLADPVMRAQHLYQIAAARARLGQFQKALETLRSIDRLTLPSVGMGKGNIQFNRALTLVKIAEAQLKAGDREGALETAREAGEVVGTIQLESQVTVPTVQIARALTKAGDLGAALKTAESLKEQTWRLSTLMDIAALLEKTGDQEAARRVWQRALEFAQNAQGAMRDPRQDLPKDFIDPPRPARPRAPISPIQVATIEARLGRKDEALRVIRAIEPPKARREALAEFIVLEAQAGDVRSALELVATLDDPALRDRTRIRIAASIPGQ